MINPIKSDSDEKTFNDNTDKTTLLPLPQTINDFITDCFRLGIYLEFMGTE